MHLRTTASGVVVALMVVVPASASVAASPGANGRIAFEQGGVIYSIRADGTDRRQLTAGTDSHSPRWSPDGRWIAFDSAGDIRLMRADGGGMRSITSGAADDVNPSWGPDGDRLVFSRSTDGTAAGRSLYVVSAAGGKAQLLTPRADAPWSPRGPPRAATSSTGTSVPVASPARTRCAR